MAIQTRGQHYYTNALYKGQSIKKLFLLKVTFSDDDKNLKWIGDDPNYYIRLDLSIVEQKTQFIREHDNQLILPKNNIKSEPRVDVFGCF
ncbi:MAG: hypothetical protein ACI9J4_000242 [Paraglaciecola sp.]